MKIEELEKLKVDPDSTSVYLAINNAVNQLYSFDAAGRTPLVKPDYPYEYEDRWHEACYTARYMYAYSYEYLLTAYYIDLAKSKGAVPVLITPITRRGSDGTANYKQHTPYQQAMIGLGKSKNVPVIDMTELTRQLYTDLYSSGGAAETAKLHCYKDDAHTTVDNTHLSSSGAQKLAEMIAEQTKELGLTIGEYAK